jgi:CheY-like chemotaxis protein
MMAAPLEVLLAEDNPGEVCLVRDARSGDGSAHRLHVVHDGEAALAFIRDGRPPVDLALLDLDLPREPGLEVLAEIKGDAALRRTPVIVLSESDAEPDVTSAYDAHANCYVRKPTDVDELMEAIGAIERFWLRHVRLALR